MKYTDKELLRKLVENDGVSRGESELCWHKYNFFAISRCFFVVGLDETCLNVKSSRVLEKGNFECGNVGF